MKLTTYDMAVLALRPLAYYPLGEAGLIAKNIAPSSSSLDGSSVGSPDRNKPPILPNDFTPSTGFNGTTAAFTTPTGVLNASFAQITVACWMKTPLNGSGYGRLCSTNEVDVAVAGYDLNEGASTDTQFYWSIGSGAALSQLASGAGTCLADTLYFVCGSYDHVLNKLYINGVQVASAGTTLTIGASSAMQIGRDGAGFGWYEGRMSRLAIWNKALTAPQVLALYRQGLAPAAIRASLATMFVAAAPTQPPGFFGSKGLLGPRQR